MFNFGNLRGRRREFKFRCSQCGKMHRGSPSFSYREPVYCAEVPEVEREYRIELSSDICRILPAKTNGNGDTIFCIRTTLEIPIHGAPEPFCWGVWVTQSEESFHRYVETFGDDQSGDGSFGWLAVSMPCYRRTGPGEGLEHLPCDVGWGLPGERPRITVQECDHPLHMDQVNGIPWKKAAEIARLVMHGSE